MNITVIGTGYVGLVTGACLAELGNQVLCLDVDQEKINLLQQGQIPIYEPGLQELVQRNAAEERLQFTADVARGVAHGLVQIIAVGTPPGSDGSADLQYVLQAASAVGHWMNDYRVIVNKSTVPVGTAGKVRGVVQQALDARGIQLGFSVVSNPEFLKEGAAIDDFNRPDRIVIGAEDGLAIELMRNLYAPFQRKQERLILMDTQSAELTKYAANAMLATRISFMNELANLAEKVGADIDAVRRGIGSDQRIGYDFLYAGCGYGGSCFPKDIRALQHTSAEYAVPLSILSAVEQANERQKLVLLQKICRRLGDNLAGRHFALWGLAFKPGTDDMREATSRVLIAALLERGATITAHDPEAMPESRAIHGERGELRYADSPLDALNGADALVIVTEWKVYKSPDFTRMKSRLRLPLVFDGRNLYEPRDMLLQGFEYYGIGRGA